jgi:hypothetical protein
MKGLSYVAVDPAIAADVRIFRMAEALGVDRFWLVGHLPQFFGALAANQPDGDIAAIPDAVLDHWAGDVPGFGVQVREHLCDAGSTQLRSWAKYNGKALASLERDRTRKREAREARERLAREQRATAKGSSTEDPGNVRGTSEDAPSKEGGTSPEDPGTVPARSAVITGTGTDTGTKLQTATHSAGVRERASAIQAVLPTRCHDALRRLLVNAHAGAAGVLDQIEGLLALNPKVNPTGPGQKPVSPEHVAEVVIRLSSTTRAQWHQGMAITIVGELQRGRPAPRTSRNGHEPAARPLSRTKVPIL